MAFRLPPVCIPCTRGPDFNRNYENELDTRAQYVRDGSGLPEIDSRACVFCNEPLDPIEPDESFGIRLPVTNLAAIIGSVAGGALGAYVVCLNLLEPTQPRSVSLLAAGPLMVVTVRFGWLLGYGLGKALDTFGTAAKRVFCLHHEFREFADPLNRYY